MRPPISESDVEDLFRLIGKRDVREPANWSRRFKNHQEKMKSGDVYQVAEVVRNLALREKGKGLSTAEKSMLERARGILVSELSFALERHRGRGPGQAHRRPGLKSTARQVQSPARARRWRRRDSLASSSAVWQRGRHVGPRASARLAWMRSSSCSAPARRASSTARSRSAGACGRAARAAVALPQWALNMPMSNWPSRTRAAARTRSGGVLRSRTMRNQLSTLSP